MTLYEYFDYVYATFGTYIWPVYEQAGAELSQAQLKLGLDFNSIDLN